VKHQFILLSMLWLIAFSAACAAQGTDLNVSNFRTALDKDGKEVTSTFSPSDVIYAVTDLASAPRGAKIEVKWIAINAADTEPNFQFDSQTIEITDEIFTGTTFFQLSNDEPWPVGQYRVDLYLNDTLVESVEFNVE
jgi:hypothetical protein